MEQTDASAILPTNKLIVSTIFRRVLFVAACASFLACTVQPTAAKTSSDTIAPETQRKTAPDFTLTDANERPITLSTYKGKVVLLDFWATWCRGCKVEIPWYVEFDKKYRAKGLAVLGVSMDDGGMKVVKPFLTQKDIRYPVVIGNDALAQRYNLASMPMTLLIDREGRIAVSHTGLVDKDNFENLIQSLLK